MSKAVLVVDMPRYCEECDLCDRNSSVQYCILNGVTTDKEVKPDWCPLCELPEFAHDDDYLYVRGFNDCLLKIYNMKKKII